ncbi:MAG: hypothetical protein HY935_07860 [Nitrosomonadales bacterium]|nr:hypothetical protein [Nitrosomonadales bacterium]
MRKVDPLQLIGKQYLLLIPAICCFALITTAESLAADNIKSDQQGAMEKRLLVEQPGELAITDRPYELLLKTGYRKDNLNWNEAGGSVNILSELKWENLKIAQICAAARLNFYSDWSLRGTFAYGSIQSGSNQDSDYNGNNRTLEFSRSNNKGGGKVRDGSIGLGRTLNLPNYVGENSLSVTPLVGLSIHQQNLTMTEGFQTLPATGSFPGLNSSYDAKWQGPWVGIDALLESGGDWSLTATGEYHWADYSAHANWNLRPEFSHPVSFIHTTKGQGILLAMEATYHVSKDWRVGFSVEVQQMSTGAGIDQTFFSDGTVGYYSLNGVNWESTSYNLGIVYQF